MYIIVSLNKPHLFAGLFICFANLCAIFFCCCCFEHLINLICILYNIAVTLYGSINLLV